VIVSDGGSKDRTVEIAHRHEARIVHARAGEVQTIASGRNLGASAARGNILIFFNADVRLTDPAGFFDRMLKAIARDGVVAATCNVKVHPEEETAGDRMFHAGFNSYCRFLNAVGMGMGRGECHVVRKNAFDAVGGYNESIAAGEDFELFLRLRKKGTIAFVRELTVTESPRRYRAFGYVRIAFLWFANALAVFLIGRSLSKAWIPVR
jgi:glycosyltransferase involved in cell wall biosynthesis